MFNASILPGCNLVSLDVTSGPGACTLALNGETFIGRLNLGGYDNYGTKMLSTNSLIKAFKREVWPF
jgi:hypothetical protein